MSLINHKVKECSFCSKRFMRVEYLNKHINRVHLKKTVFYDCSLCNSRFIDIEKLKQHKRTHTKRLGLFYLYKQTLDSHKIFRHIVPSQRVTVNECFHPDVMNEMYYLLLKDLNVSPIIKFSILFAAEFTKVNSNDEILEVQIFPIRSGIALISKVYSSTIPQLVSEITTDIETRADDIVSVGSGWVLTDGIYIDLAMTQIKGLSGSGGMKYKAIRCLNKNKKSDYDIPNPSFIHSINNTDEFCFIDAVASAFIGQKNNYSKDFYNYRDFAEKTFKYKNLSFPLKVTDVIKFEKLNSNLYLNINILFVEIALDGLSIFPGYISKICYPKKLSQRINLLLTLGETPETNHYHFIKDVNKFIRKSYCNEINKKKSYSKEVVCLNCFSKFSNIGILHEHEYYCYKNKCQVITLADKGMEFKDQDKLGKSNVIGFFDFECCNETIICPNCEKNICICQKKTKKLKTQIPICYSLLIVNSIDQSIILQKSYVGYDAAENLIQTLINIEDSLNIYITSVNKIKMTSENQIDFDNATECHICLSGFVNSFNDKVRDHDHANGNYLGAAHNICNLNRRKSRTVPLYCHNFIGYDSHPILKCLGAVFKNHRNENIRIDILPKNFEKITNIRIGMFTLNDSLSFLSAALSTLVEGLKKSNHDFKYIKQMEVLLDKNNYKEKLELMMSKGIFPYDWVSSINQLKNQSIFPEKKSFHNILLNSDISDEDYLNGLKVFNSFPHIKNMADYMQFYCDLDVFLLCEVFNKFRDLAIKDFELDPCRYLSLPSFAFSSMLRMTGACIEPLTDINMFLMIKRGIRGGHSFISERILKVGEHPKCEHGTTDFISKSLDTSLLYIDWYIGIIIFIFYY